MTTYCTIDKKLHTQIKPKPLNKEIESTPKNSILSDFDCIDKLLNSFIDLFQIQNGTRR